MDGIVLIVIAVIGYVWADSIWKERRRRAEQGGLPPVGYDRQQPIVVQRGGMGPLGAGCLIVTFLLVLFLAATVGLPVLAVLYAVVKMPIWN